MTQQGPHPAWEELLQGLRTLQLEIRDILLSRRGEAGMRAASREAEDTIYGVDGVLDPVLPGLVEKHLARGKFRVTLLAEGLEETVLGPSGGAPFRLLVDPLDGTRPFMFDKRSGWVLSGLAPDEGKETRLSRVFLAVMTEVPPTRQWRAEQVWALRGMGAKGWTFDLDGLGREGPYRPAPSQAESLAHGFAQVARFFPGVKVELAALEEEILDRVLGEESRGRGHVFEDQYPSSGGQLFELIAGRDRFTADLRPLFKEAARQKGLPRLLCCHPYDLSAELVAREAGVLVETPWGEPLDPPMDTTTDVAWAGYANSRIRDLVAPVLQAVLRERGLAPGAG